VDISGSYLRLNDSRFASKAEGESAPIQTALVIKKGQLVLQLPKHAKENLDLNELSQILKKHDLKSLLSVANAELEIDGSMSDLAWITVLLKNSHNLAIAGSGKLNIDARLDSGWPSEGTLARIVPSNLEMKLLDYLLKMGLLYK